MKRVQKLFRFDRGSDGGGSEVARFDRESDEKSSEVVRLDRGSDRGSSEVPTSSGAEVLLPN